jgi:hypothetical protein
MRAGMSARAAFGIPDTADPDVRRSERAVPAGHPDIAAKSMA